MADDPVRTPPADPPAVERTMTVDQIIAQLDALQAQGVPFERLLECAVQGVHELDANFHWTGIYELFPDDVLRLGPYVGAPTEHCFIGVGRGVCGSAVAERRNMNIPDVSRHENYLPCSSETKSELVVLIRSGDTIHAQIDIDSHVFAAFDDVAVASVQRVADRLAKAYDRRARMSRAA
jgi:L-methionine (R)-S-oxide reductase